MTTRGGFENFFSSFEMKSGMENPVLVLKKLYLLKNHHLFSNPPLYTFSRQFWVQTVSETIWSSMSGRQPISKIWENLISVYHPSTRCKNFRGIGWKLRKKSGALTFGHFPLRNKGSKNISDPQKIFFRRSTKKFFCIFKMKSDLLNTTIAKNRKSETKIFFLGLSN